MSFKAVQSKIEKEGYGAKAAGAILAKKTRDASPAAKRANPNLKKVNGAAPKGKKHMEIEETDNGGFISKTTHIQPRDENHGYRPNPVTTAQHGSRRALQAHIRQTFPEKKPAVNPAAAPQWAGVASKMLRGGGDY
jgi:hypothetical protein